MFQRDWGFALRNKRITAWSDGGMSDGHSCLGRGERKTKRWRKHRELDIWLDQEKWREIFFAYLCLSAMKMCKRIWVTTIFFHYFKLKN